MTTSEDQTDVRVRVAVYEQVIAAGRPPSTTALAERLALPAPEVDAALERLAAARALVLQSESREILMANPFSAVPTPYLVRAGTRSYYGNCIWDALGIPAMLGADATIETSCACCGEAWRPGQATCCRARGRALRDSPRRWWKTSSTTERP